MAHIFFSLISSTLISDELEDSSTIRNRMHPLSPSLTLDILLTHIHTGWEDVEDEEEEGEEEGEEEEEEAVQEVSKPVRDIRKRADATRILTAEDFKLIGAPRLMCNTMSCLTPHLLPAAAFQPLFYMHPVVHFAPQFPPFLNLSNLSSPILFPSNHFSSPERLREAQSERARNPKNRTNTYVTLFASSLQRLLTMFLFLFLFLFLSATHPPHLDSLLG